MVSGWSHKAPCLGLSGVPYFTGHPVFGDLCPVSRKELLRDAICPVFLTALLVSSIKILDNLFKFIFVSLMKLSLYSSVIIYSVVVTVLDQCMQNMTKMYIYVTYKSIGILHDSVLTMMA